MAIADILAYVDDSEQNHQFLENACSFADKHDAHLSALFVTRTPHIPVYSGIEAPISATVMAQLEAQQQKVKASVKQEFDKATHGMSKTSWIEVDFDIDNQPHAIARNHDIVMLAQADPESGNALRKHILETIVLRSGRPVIVTPHDQSHPIIGNRIVLAWNNSNEASRALHDALPLLKRADSVLVAEINPSKEEDFPCSDIATHLARHGVTVETQTEHCRKKEVGKQLNKLAMTFGADLIVMGAYGHSRITEIVLGGVTRFMFEKMTTPIFVSH